MERLWIGPQAYIKDGLGRFYGRAWQVVIRALQKTGNPPPGRPTKYHSKILHMRRAYMPEYGVFSSAFKSGRVWKLRKPHPVCAFCGKQVKADFHLYPAESERGRVRWDLISRICRRCAEMDQELTEFLKLCAVSAPSTNPSTNQ